MAISAVLGGLAAADWWRCRDGRCLEEELKYQELIAPPAQPVAASGPGEEPRSAQCTKGAQCFEVFFLTTRKLEETAARNSGGRANDFFGSGLDDGFTLGKARLALPFVAMEAESGGAKRRCTDIDVDENAPKASDRMVCENDLIKQGTQILTFWVKRAVQEEETISDSAELRQPKDLGNLLSLSALGPRRAKSFDRHYEVLAGDVQVALNRQRRIRDARRIDTESPDQTGADQHAVFIYIHGFDTPFDRSLKNAGQLTADLSFWLNPEPAAERDFALGVPIAISWPALGFELNPDWDVTRRNYFESRLRADYAALSFQRFVKELAKRTDVTTINIVAHSMGNRIALPIYALTREDLKNKEGDAVRLHVVHVAADVGRDAFLAAASEKSHIRTTVVSSDRDNALAEASKWFADEKTKSILSLDRKGASEKKLKFIGNVKSLLEKLGREPAGWADEDRCRVGRLTGERCSKSLGGDIQTVDSSAFATDDGLIQFGHNYFEDAPMMLADLSCALRGIEPDSGRRSLSGWTPKDANEDAKWRPGDQSKVGYWKIEPPRLANTSEPQSDSDFSDGVDPNCKATQRLYYYLDPEPKPLAKTQKPLMREFFFDLESAEPCARSGGSVSGCIGGGQAAQQKIAEIADSIGKAFRATKGASGVSIEIEGFTDPSDRTPNGTYDQCGLKQRRARAVFDLLEPELRSRDIKATYALIPPECPPDVAATVGGVRDSRQRRAELRVWID